MKYAYTLLFPAVAAAVGVNPDPNFDPANSNGDFGPFTPVRVPDPSATGGPTTVNAAKAQALQKACDNWSADTGMVSNFQNIGKTTPAGKQFNSAANIAFLAEVDELTHKGILDAVIGNDPQVSIANLTLTNGVFQSVVNNLQVMSIQGKSKQNLIDTINSVRCTQILPSIDTYMAVAAQVIGPGATLRKAIRPAACAQVLAQNANNSSAFPNVPNVPGGTPLGQQTPASGGTGNTGTGANGSAGIGAGAGNGGSSAASSSRGRKGAKTRSGAAAAASSAAPTAGTGGASSAFTDGSTGTSADDGTSTDTTGSLGTDGADGTGAAASSAASSVTSAAALSAPSAQSTRAGRKAKTRAYTA